MIIFEHVVLPSDEQMEFVIEGMRNPMNSWNNSDSYIGFVKATDECPQFIMGAADIRLAKKLAGNGPVHRKYMRMMPIMVRITAPLYWWKEFDTYKVGTVSNSCSTMHKIHDKEFEMDDFSIEHLTHASDDILKFTIQALNEARTKFLKSKSKDDWWQMIQLLPSSYNQTRNISMNYEVLSTIYNDRRFHKLNEWIDMIHWIDDLPHSSLIKEASNYGKTN